MLESPARPEDIMSDHHIEWLVSARPIDYASAVAFMERRVELISEGRASEVVWLCEHPALYTAGTSAKPQDLLDPHRFPVFASGRGGQYTYHGPGQRIVYVMLDVKRRFADVRAFVKFLEGWTIEVLDSFGVAGEIRSGRVGVWVRRSNAGVDTEDKIAAIGIRLRRWVSYHGLAINVSPDLEHFSGIVPCGIRGHGITSLEDLNVRAGMADLDGALRRTFSARFPNVCDAPASSLERSAQAITPGAL